MARASNERSIVRERLTVADLQHPNDERELFVRDGAGFRFGDDLQKGAGDPRFIEYVAKGTRSNQLFLNEAHEREVGALEPAFQWFSTTLIIIGPDTQYAPLVEDTEREPVFKEFLQSVLAWADTSIVTVDARRRELDADTHREVKAVLKNKRVQNILRALPRPRERMRVVESPDGQTTERHRDVDGERAPGSRCCGDERRLWLGRQQSLFRSVEAGYCASSPSLRAATSCGASTVPPFKHSIPRRRVYEHYSSGDSVRANDSPSR